MNTAEELKEIVRQKYGEIAQSTDLQGVSCGCGPSSCCRPSSPDPANPDATYSILMNDEFQTYQQDGRSIFSITVFAEKASDISTTAPVLTDEKVASCCGPDCCS